MDIKQYWNDRAQADASKATTDDIHLRLLERSVLRDQLTALGCNPKSNVLDVGCGDGATILELEKNFGCKSFGLDYSSAMIGLAKQAAAAVGSRAQFEVGDVRELSQLSSDRQFDFILTDRCLINLETKEEQYSSIRQIASSLKSGGYYLSIENFVEGNDRLNELRCLFDLPPIPMRWHNRFFSQGEFAAEARRHFKTVDRVEFSSAYYFATRVIYSKLCAERGEQPDYKHAVHEKGKLLPFFGDFSPIKLHIMQK